MVNVALGKFVELQRGNTYKSALLGKPGPKLLGLGSIQKNGGFRGDKLKTYGGETDPRMLLVPGDIYVSLKDVTQSADLLGAVARVPPDVELGRVTQDTVKLVFKDGAPRELIYWVLMTPQYREFCRSFATGTTNLGLPREDFLSFPIPELSNYRQHLIKLLQSLEDKIELNRRMNETLEAMARALFRDWFVDFGPTRAKMAGEAPYLSPDLWSLFPDHLDDAGKPEGWEHRPVGDFATIKGGKQLTKQHISIEGSYPVFGGAGIMGYAERYNAEGFVISVGRVGAYCGQFFLHRGRAWINNNASLITPNDMASPDWLFLALRHVDMDLIKKGAAQPFVSNGDIAKVNLVWPDVELIDAVSSLIAPLARKVEANNKESRTLAQTRDLLLPRLMSGELRVAEAARAVEAVL